MAHRILVAEDSRTQALKIANLLQAQGYEVVVASDGRKALEWLSSNKPSIVISDILMPEMDGYELCRQIKTMPSISEVPVMLLTILSDPEEVLKGLTAGSDCFVTKPYDEEFLLSNIERLLPAGQEKELEKKPLSVEITFEGKKRIIQAEQQQTIKLLLSIYEGAIHQSKKLIQTQEQLQIINDNLELLVEERTSEWRAIVKKHKMAEEALRLKNFVFEVSIAAKSIAGTDGIITDCNESFLRHWGYPSKAEVTGKPISDFLDDAQKVAEILEGLNSNEKWEGEYTARRKDHTTFIAHGMATVLKDETGKLIGYQSAVIDITDRKTAEEKLIQSEARFRSTFDQSPVGSVMVGLDKKFIRCNPAFCRFLGYEESELIGKTIMEVTYPEDVSLGMNEMKEIAGGKSETARLEKRYVKKDGNVVWGELTISLVRDSNNKPLYFLPIIQDISERKKAEEALINAREKAVQSDRLKSTFLANMSHEIRTPMNAIVGFAGLLKESGISETEREQYSAIIESRSEDLMHTINELLDISRIESGNITVVKETVSLNGIIDELEATFSQKLFVAKKTGISLVTKKALPDAGSQITTDAYILKHVFSNLIDNAIKFTAEGDVNFGYDRPSNGFITCFVADTGIGIPESDQQIIFEHFRQAETLPAHTYGGTGLGLAICRGSLALLGGEISVKSAPGSGSTFYFTLPFEPKASPDTIAKNKPQTREDRGAYYWPGKKILIVEDDEANMEFLQVILRTTGADFTSLFSGRDLRMMYDKLGNFDLLLLDVRLPDASGWELAREVKARYPGLPVIAQTAYAMSSDKLKSVEAGCDEYITKPIIRTKLYEMLAKFL